MQRRGDIPTSTSTTPNVVAHDQQTGPAPLQAENTSHGRFVCVDALVRPSTRPLDLVRGDVPAQRADDRFGMVRSICTPLMALSRTGNTCGHLPGKAHHADSTTHGVGLGALGRAHVTGWMWSCAD
jgi:hypothetical protein